MSIEFLILLVFLYLLFSSNGSRGGSIGIGSPPTTARPTSIKPQAPPKKESFPEEPR